MKRTAVIFLMAAALAIGGCAVKSMLITPGRVEVASAVGQPAEKWNFWVRKIADERPAGELGTPRIGKLEQRFDATGTVVHLDMLPEQYIGEQLKLFLLKTGMEASSPEKAKTFLEVSLTEFSVEADKTGVLDKLDLNLDYTVRFYDLEGKLLGTVRVPEKRWIKVFAPVASRQESLEVLIRDAVASTLEVLSQSEVYKQAAAAQ